MSGGFGTILTVTRTFEFIVDTDPPEDHTAETDCSIA